jgi:hypothetical protein
MNWLILDIILVILIPFAIFFWKDIIDPRNRRARQRDRQLAKKIKDDNMRGWL